MARSVVPDFESKGRGFKSLRALSLVFPCCSEKINDLQAHAVDISMESV